MVGKIPWVGPGRDPQFNRAQLPHPRREKFIENQRLPANVILVCTVDFGDEVLTLEATIAEYAHFLGIDITNGPGPSFRIIVVAISEETGEEVLSSRCHSDPLTKVVANRDKSMRGLRAWSMVPRPPFSLLRIRIDAAGF